MVWCMTGNSSELIMEIPLIARVISQSYTKPSIFEELLRWVLLEMHYSKGTPLSGDTINMYWHFTCFLENTRSENMVILGWTTTTEITGISQNSCSTEIVIVSIWRCRLASIGNSIVEIRWSGFPILVRRHLYIEWEPWPWLTHWGLVTPFNNIYLGQHWIR